MTTFYLSEIYDSIFLTVWYISFASFRTSSLSSSERDSSVCIQPTKWNFVDVFEGKLQVDSLEAMQIKRFGQFF